LLPHAVCGILFPYAYKEADDDEQVVLQASDAAHASSPCIAPAFSCSTHAVQQQQQHLPF
jgi:hypothetical protein